MQKQTVHLFALDTMADWEPSYAIARIHDPAWQEHPGRYQVETVGLTSDQVTTMGGIKIVPDRTLAALQPEESAMLILPGAGVWGQAVTAPAVEKAEAFLEAGVPVAAICGATYGLADGGLLNGRPHTSNALEFLQMSPRYRGDAFYRHEPALTDGNLVTAGATAALEFAYQILKKLEVFRPDLLEAWYALFKTGDPRHFAVLAAAG